MFGCKHKFGEVKNGYQYCEKCGKAIVVSCSHKWETEDILQRDNAINDFVGLVYILKCSKCGEIKKINIS